MKAKLQDKSFKSQHIDQSLAESFVALNTPEEAHAFLTDLCTPAEIQAMQDRWAVVAHLKAGASYREIYQATGVSVTTIGRVARCITHGSGGYNRIFERLNEK